MTGMSGRAAVGVRPAAGSVELEPDRQMVGTLRRAVDPAALKGVEANLIDNHQFRHMWWEGGQPQPPSTASR